MYMSKRLSHIFFGLFGWLSIFSSSKKSDKVKLMPLSSKVKIEDIASDLEARFEKTTKRFQNSSECRQILRKIIVDLSEENWKSLYKEIIGKGSI